MFMVKFQDFSLKHKLTAIIVLVCGLMLLAISTIFVGNEMVTFQKSAAHNISALAKVTAKNSTAALAFQDKKTAEELLQALRVESQIKGAVIYDAEGKRFAGYGGPKAMALPLQLDVKNISGGRRNEGIFLPSKRNILGLTFDYLDVLQPVVLNGRRIGWVLLRADQGWIYARVKWFAFVVFVITLALILLSLVISSRLQRIISAPIESLANTMQRVKRLQDYSIRVESKGKDELGALMDGFNNMLEQIQMRDRRLEQNRRDLERMILLRTEALKLSEAQKKRLMIQQKIHETYGELVSRMNSIDTSDIVEKSLNKMAEHTGAAWGRVYLRRPDKKVLVVKKSFTSGPLDRRVSDWLDEKAGLLADEALEQTTILSTKKDGATQKEGNATPYIRVFPLSFRERRIGVLALAWFRDPDKDTHTFLKNATRQLGVAIHNALTFEDLRKKSAQLEKSNLELERASRMKSVFLANMSHELRTPLNAIIGFSELMVDQLVGPLNDVQEEYLSDILTSGRHLLELINEILDLSKVEAGKMTLELTDVSVREMLESSMTMIKQKAVKHNIDLTIQTENIPDIFWVDSRKIKQVLYNLVSNAVKFTDDGGSISLMAEVVSRSWIVKNIPDAFKDGFLTRLDDKSSSFLKVSVVDTGIGIGPDSLTKIFDVFEQVDTSAAKKYQGTGLGLALCRNFVELHGGAIWAESIPGKGSTFTFVIPLKIASNNSGDVFATKKLLHGPL